MKGSQVHAILMNRAPVMHGWAVCCSTLLVGFSLANAQVSNLWGFDKYMDERGMLTVTAEKGDISNPPAGLRPAPRDLWRVETNLPAKLMFNTGTNPVMGFKYAVGYFRGPMFSLRQMPTPFNGTQVAGTNVASIFIIIRFQDEPNSGRIAGWQDHAGLIHSS